MPLSEYTDQALLNSMFGKTSNFGALASVPAIYVGLSSTTPVADGTNVTEPSTGSYARVLANSWTAATLANPSLLENSGTITFPTATGNWVSSANLTYVVLYDAITSGNFLGFGALTVPQPVVTGNIASFAIDALQITLA